MARHWVGTSGWSYDHWAGLVYLKGLKRGDWLAHYVTRLSSVEINASFYHLPRAPMLEGWVARTPEHFLFAVKAWRVITHYRKLADWAGCLGARAGEGRDAYVYFDNTDEADYAVRNAERLAEMVRGASAPRRRGVANVARGRARPRRPAQTLSYSPR